MTQLTLGHRPILRGASLLSSILLAGCTSIALPPWQSTVRELEADQAAAVQRQPVTAPLATRGPLSTIEPASTAPVTTPRTMPAAPYAAAVAARFPEPDRLYITPGLGAGRSSWTSQSELAGWLREQARQARLTAPGQAAVVTIGTSQAGLPIEALVFSSGVGADAAALKATERPTVLLLAQQHGNAPASAEALLVVARELAQGPLRPLLSRINVLIVPRANPDGAAKARRLTDNGFDMAHDHLVLETPEAQAIAKLARDYQPTVVLEAQEYPAVGALVNTLGGLPKADAWVAYATTANLPEFLTKAAEEWFRQPLVSALTAAGLSSEWPSSTSSTSSTSSIMGGKTVAWGDLQPDNSANVHGLKNRISLTVASRGVGLERAHSQRRLYAQVTAITSVLNSTAERASELAQLKPYLDLEVTNQACQKDRVIEAQATPTRRTLQLIDADSGADQPVTIQTQSARLLRTAITRVSPCGYWLGAKARQAIERLRLHGVQVMQVRDTAAFLGDFYQAKVPATSASNVNTMVAVELLRGVIDAPAGSYYVPLDQALGNLVFVALEPDSPNSYFSQALIAELSAVARVMTQPAANLREVP
jgi:hypothetical protein